METFRAVMSGRVQGVNFRFASAVRARELGVHGYVRNLHNGDVEVVAQGIRERLESYLDFLRRGPPAADVEHVRVDWLEHREYETFRDFEIRR